MSSSAVARKFDKSARPYGLRYAARRACGKDLPSSQPKWPSGTPHPCSSSAYYRLCKFRAQHDGALAPRCGHYDTTADRTTSPAGMQPWPSHQAHTEKSST